MEIEIHRAMQETYNRMLARENEWLQSLQYRGDKSNDFTPNVLGWVNYTYSYLVTAPPLNGSTFSCPKCGPIVTLYDASLVCPQCGSPMVKNPCKK